MRRQTIIPTNTGVRRCAEIGTETMHHELDLRYSSSTVEEPPTRASELPTSAERASGSSALNMWKRFQMPDHRATARTRNSPVALCRSLGAILEGAKLRWEAAFPSMACTHSACNPSASLGAQRPCVHNERTQIRAGRTLLPSQAFSPLLALRQIEMS